MRPQAHPQPWAPGFLTQKLRPWMWGNLSHGAEKWVSDVIMMATETLATHSIHTHSVCRAGCPGGRGHGRGIGVSPDHGFCFLLAVWWPWASPRLDGLQSPSLSDILFLLLTLSLWFKNTDCLPGLKSPLCCLPASRRLKSFIRKMGEVTAVASAGCSELSVHIWGGAWPTVMFTQGLATTSIITSSLLHN